VHCSVGHIGIKGSDVMGLRDLKLHDKFDAEVSRCPDHFVTSMSVFVLCKIVVRRLQAYVTVNMIRSMSLGEL
jgi:hypothetical protein